MAKEPAPAKPATKMPKDKEGKRFVGSFRERKPEEIGTRRPLRASQDRKS